MKKINKRKDLSPYIAENTRHLSYGSRCYGYQGNKAFSRIYRTIFVDQVLHITPQEKAQTWEIGWTGRPHWTAKNLSIPPDVWYSECYKHPSWNGLIPRRVGSTGVHWWVLEHGLTVQTSFKNTRYESPSRHFGSRYVPIRWSWVIHTELLITKRRWKERGYGFPFATHDNCGYLKYPRMRMCIHRWTTHEDKN